jgi:hypothetical protein
MVPQAQLDEGWLCPALFKYFEAAPQRIHAQFKAKKGSVPAG